MNFMINGDELMALGGLPHLQQLVYLRGVRPYMDVKTGIVGIKRRISYQSIAEQLYIESHQGIKSCSFTKTQIRRALSTLERVGLITMQSKEFQLILKCDLATQGYSIQNKVITNLTQQADTNPAQKHPVQSSLVEVMHTKHDIPQPSKADTPLKNSYLYFLFEKFWESYPQKKSKQKAQAVFEQLNPDPNLFAVIMQNLEEQINHAALMNAHGQWVPAWKYPENWLANRCWEEALSTEILEEQDNAKHTKNYKKQSYRDPFCPPEENDAEDTGNVIQLQEYRKGK